MTEVLWVIVLVAAAFACGAAVWAFTEVARTMRSVKALSEDTRVRLVPLLDKADVTVDAVNAELLRVDAIVTRFEDASERVSSASGTISGIVNAPTELVNEMALRVRRAWHGRHRDTSDPRVGGHDARSESQTGEGEPASLTRSKEDDDDR